MRDRYRFWSDGSAIVATAVRNRAGLVSIDRSAGVRIVAVDIDEFEAIEVLPPWARGRRGSPGTVGWTGRNGNGISSEWWQPGHGRGRGGGGYDPGFGGPGRGGYGPGYGVPGGRGGAGPGFGDRGDGDLHGDDPFRGDGSGLWLPGRGPGGGRGGPGRGRGSRGDPGSIFGYDDGYGDDTGERDDSNSGRQSHKDGQGHTVTDTTYNGRLIRRESEWNDDQGFHHKSWDGQGNRESEHREGTAENGTHGTSDTQWSSTGELLSETVSTTSADGNTTTTNSTSSNGDGTYTTTVSRTEKKDDGSTTTITKTDDGHGKITETTTTTPPPKGTGSKPGPDDEGGAEERPFSHLVVVGKSLDWQLPTPEPGEGSEGVPLGVMVQDALGDLLGEFVGGNSDGWGDSSAESPDLPPFEEYEVGGDDTSEGDWGFIHPQALVGRALRYSTARSGTRLARGRLRTIVEAMT
jgi:hypothetical protein